MSLEGEQGLAFFDLLTLEAVNVGNDSRHRRCDARGCRSFALHSRLRLDRAVCRHSVAQRRQRNLSDVDGDFRFARRLRFLLVTRNPFVPQRVQPKPNGCQNA